MAGRSIEAFPNYAQRHPVIPRKPRNTHQHAHRLAVAASVVAAVCDGLQSFGVAATQALASAVLTADAAIDQWNGLNLFFPSEHPRRSALRNLRMRDTFDGTNYAALSLQFDMTERHVRSILARSREQDIEDSQPSEFTHEFMGLIRVVLTGEGLAPQHAVKVARLAGDRLAAECGGRQICFPTRYSEQLVDLDERAHLAVLSTGDEATAAQELGLGLTAQHVAAMAQRGGVRLAAPKRRALAAFNGSAPASAAHHAPAHHSGLQHGR